MPDIAIRSGISPGSRRNHRRGFLFTRLTCLVPFYAQKRSNLDRRKRVVRTRGKGRSKRESVTSGGRSDNRRNVVTRARPRNSGIVANCWEIVLRADSCANAYNSCGDNAIENRDFIRLTISKITCRLCKINVSHSWKIYKRYFNKCESNHKSLKRMTIILNIKFVCVWFVLILI